jgi:hypothetical protein
MANGQVPVDTERISRARETGAASQNSKKTS